MFLALRRRGQAALRLQRSNPQNTKSEGWPATRSRPSFRKGIFQMLFTYRARSRVSSSRSPYSVAFWSAFARTRSEHVTTVFARTHADVPAFVFARTVGDEVAT